MLYFDEAVERIVELNKCYNDIRKENSQIYNELSYLKQAIKELGLEETIKDKIKRIQEEEFPF